MGSGITVSSYRVLTRRGSGSVYHEDMEIRPAEPEDALAVARVHVRTWQAAYRSLLPDHYLDQLRAEDRAARYQFRKHAWDFGKRSRRHLDLPEYFYRRHCRRHRQKLNRQRRYRNRSGFYHGYFPGKITGGCRNNQFVQCNCGKGVH